MNHFKNFYYHDYKFIFVDGYANNYRENIDLHLSHWQPNYTPKDYFADTSTEICLNFVKNPLSGFEDAIIINNHLDCDGILSAFCLTYPEIALKHEKLLIEVAYIADFNAFKSELAFNFYTLLSDFIKKQKKLALKSVFIYRKAFSEIKKILAKKLYLKESSKTKWLFKQMPLLDELSFYRGNRLVAFYFKNSLLKQYQKRQATVISSFDQGILKSEILPRFLRNKLDFEKFKLMIIEHDNAYFYQLLVPEYSWAQTKSLYEIKNKILLGTNSFTFDLTILEKIITKLNEIDSGAGRWQIIKEIKPFFGELNFSFPVFMGYFKANSLALSKIPPKELINYLTEWESSL